MIGSEDRPRVPTTSDPNPPTQTVTPSSPGSAGGAAPRFSGGAVLADRYRISRYIARGGMGEVYEVEDLHLGTRVALKTIRPDAEDAAAALSRFKHEVLLARKVTHPNVCRLYDLGLHRTQTAAGTVEDTLFLTMELLPGDGLSEHIARKGSLPTSEVLQIAEQLAGALDAAHQAGVIHRDFKSSNVMLVSTGAEKTPRVVVTDFGLARTSARSDDGSTSVSESGFVVGTPAYMAPEQVLGRPLSAAADIYAFGVVLYEMLTGRRPFDGGSGMGVAARKLTEEPPSLRVHAPDLDARWDAVVLRCLARDPAARFARASDVVNALRAEGPLASPESPARVATVAPSPPPDTPARSNWGLGAARPSNPRVLAALGLAALAGLIAFSLRHPSGGPVGPALPTPRAHDVVARRRTLAVLPFRNTSGRAEAEWLSVALGEVFGAELAAGGQWRVLGSDQSARTTAEPTSSRTTALDRAALSRVGRALGVDLVVSGAYDRVAGGSLVRVDLAVQDVATGRTLASADGTGTEDQVSGVVMRAGETVRKALGIAGTTPAEASEVQASLPSSPRAARLYAEGLSRLRRFDPLRARDLLLQATKAEPEHPLPHAALAEAWAALGREDEARKAIDAAAERAEHLPALQARVVRARAHEISKGWPDAIAALRGLAEAVPDEIEYPVRLAAAQTAAGRPREALAALDDFERRSPGSATDPRPDLARAKAYQQLGEFKQEQQFAASATRLARAAEAPLLLAEARALEAVALQSLGETERAAAAVEEARSLFAAAGDRAGLARTLELFAIGLYLQGDLDGAAPLLRRCLEIHRELGNEMAVARVQSNLGNVLLDQGRSAEATQQVEQALAAFKRLGAKTPAADALVKLGAQLQGKGDLAQAQQRYEQALQLYEELGDKSGVAQALTNVGEVQCLRGHLAEARKMHEEALTLNREIGEKPGAAYDLFRLGEVFRTAGDSLVARQRLEEALKAQQAMGDTSGAAETQIGLARLLTHTGQAADGERRARAAEQVLRTSGERNLQVLALAAVVEAQIEQGRLEAARETATALRTSVKDTDDLRSRIAASIADGRVGSASGDATANQRLAGAAAQAKGAGLLAEELEARLYLGRAELAARRETGRKRIEQVARDARARGLGEIAGLAQRALAEVR